MKSIYTILLALVCHNLIAQDILFPGDTIPINVNTEYRQDMNYLMSQLNFNDVISGLLLDYGIAFNDLSVHSGTQNDSVTFNLDYWRSLYATIVNAKNYKIIS